MWDIIKQPFIEIWNKGFIARVKFILAIIVIIALIIGVIYKDKLKSYSKNMTYPKAKNMPEALTISLDEALKRLQKAIAAKGLSMKKGLSKEQISGLEKENGMKISEQLVKFYMWHDGSNASGPHGFYPLGDAMAGLLKVRELTKSANKLQRSATGLPIPHDSHMDNMLTIYSNSAYYTLFYDLTRKPGEGAYGLSYKKPFTYCFFPALRNAIAALAECYETGAFKLVKKTTARSTLVAGSGGYELQADDAAVKKIMKKYGSYVGKYK